MSLIFKVISQYQKRSKASVFNTFDLTCALHRNGPQFPIPHRARWLRTRKPSEKHNESNFPFFPHLHLFSSHSFSSLIFSLLFCSLTLSILLVYLSIVSKVWLPHLYWWYKNVRSDLANQVAKSLLQGRQLIPSPSGDERDCLNRVATGRPPLQNAKPVSTFVAPLPRKLRSGRLCAPAALHAT